MQNSQPQDLDWRLLYQQARKKKSRQSKGAADWDKKAASFAGRTVGSVYVEKFMELLAPQPHRTILDVGCGPGTLAIPLAARTKQVTALDFSGNMLKILEQRAAEQGIKNISTHKLSWQDDWRQHGVCPCDVVIASRSLTVPDLWQALKKLDSFAGELVCVTDKVGHGPFDPYAFAAVGRELEQGPDYMYTVNMLRQMGCLPRVDYIRLEEKLEYLSFAEALSGCGWMFRDLNKNEMSRLERYVRSVSSVRKDGTVVLRRRYVPTWAYISWRPKEQL